MHEHPFIVEYARSSLTPIDPRPITLRDYATPFGRVRIHADWSPLATNGTIVHIPLVVRDDRAMLHARDIPSFLELFLHDVYLACNLAEPASFGGVLTPMGGAYRCNELSLDAWVFQYASAGTVPLAEVVRWLDSLALGTQQLATTPMHAVLINLLHLARSEASDNVALAILTQCLEHLGIDRIHRGAPPVIHPMHDEVLDDRLENESLDWSGVIDAAATAVVTAVQRWVRYPVAVNGYGVR